MDWALCDLTAIAIQGAKGVGKTATATQRATTIVRLADPLEQELLSADPQRINTVPAPVLIDEWHRFPQVWGTVRRSVDEQIQPGRFILTGSANPVGAAIHSGAGRIISLRMRPLSLAERHLSSPPIVSLAELLTGQHSAIMGESTLTLADYTDEILRSGFPGIRPLSERGRQAQLDSYLSSIVSREFAEQGVVVRRPDTLRSWLTAYAAATSTTATYQKILEAATPGQSQRPAKATTITYRDVLSQLWLLDPISAWTPSTNLLGRLALAPKHQLADPALAARLLGATKQSLLAGTAPKPMLPRKITLLGALFEHLVGLSVQVYAGDIATVHHFRSNNGDHEVDLIVETADGVVAFEVKLSAGATDADCKHLRWLKARLGDRLLDAALINTGKHAYRRADGIAVIPAALLGP